MRTTVFLAALITAGGPGVAYAIPAFFEYTQTDAATGAGTISAEINTTRFGGPGLLTFTGAMPTATVTSIYSGPPIPAFAVGAIDPGTDGFGEHNGVHIGWIVSTTISAVDPNSPGDVWAVEVPLNQIENGFYHWTVDFLEDPAAGFDFQTVNGTDPLASPDEQARFAVWVGDYLSGHRETQPRQGFDPFDPQVGPESHSFDEATTPGGNSFGDSLGLNAAIRAGMLTPASGPLPVDQMFYEGALLADETTMTLNGAPKPKLPVLPTTPFSAVLDVGPMAQRVQATHLGVPDPSDGNTPMHGGVGNPSGISIDVGPVLISAAVDNVGLDEQTEGNIIWIDRGDSASAEDLARLGEDFVVNVNDGIVRLTLSDLPPGDYDAVSYHVEPDVAGTDSGNPSLEPGDAVRVFVDNGDGSGFVQKGELTGRTLDLGGVGNLTNQAVTDASIDFAFTADGLNPVVILFDSIPDLALFPGGCGNDPDEAFCEVPFNGLSISYEPGFPGDVNGDELVNELDLTIIRMNFFEAEIGGSPVELSDGDLNRDNVVDFVDYRIWKQNAPPALAGLALFVPEPTTLALSLAGAGLWGMRRRRMEGV